MDEHIAGTGAETWLPIVQTIGTALSGVGAFIVLLLIWKQIARESRVAGCGFILKVSSDFESPEMRDRRCRLASLVLSTSYLTNPELDARLHAQMRGLASPVLGWFEDLGMMLRKNLIPTYFVWSTNEQQISFYYQAMSPYISKVRESDPHLYSDFRYLYEKVRRYERIRSPSKLLREVAALARRRLSGPFRGARPDAWDGVPQDAVKQLRNGFVRELNLAIRPLETEDLAHTLVPVRLRKRLLDYHRRGNYVAIAEILRSGAAGHEYLAYVVGTTVEVTEREYEGEIVELFVNSHFRSNGIGHLLCDHFLRLLRQWDIRSCRVLLPSDAPSFSPYLSLGFVTSALRQDHFRTGRHAVELRLKLPAPGGAVMHPVAWGAAFERAE